MLFKMRTPTLQKPVRTQKVINTTFENLIKIPKRAHAIFKKGVHCCQMDCTGFHIDNSLQMVLVCTRDSKAYHPQRHKKTWKTNV